MFCVWQIGSVGSDISFLNWRVNIFGIWSVGGIQLKLDSSRCFEGGGGKNNFHLPRQGGGILLWLYNFFMLIEWLRKYKGLLIKNGLRNIRPLSDTLINAYNVIYKGEKLKRKIKLGIISTYQN